MSDCAVAEHRKINLAGELFSTGFYDCAIVMANGCGTVLPILIGAAFSLRRLATEWIDSSDQAPQPGDFVRLLECPEDPRCRNHIGRILRLGDPEDEDEEDDGDALVDKAVQLDGWMAALNGKMDGELENAATEMLADEDAVGTLEAMQADVEEEEEEDEDVDKMTVVVELRSRSCMSRVLGRCRAAPEIVVVTADRSQVQMVCGQRELMWLTAGVCKWCATCGLGIEDPEESGDAAEADARDGDNGTAAEERTTAAGTPEPDEFEHIVPQSRDTSETYKNQRGFVMP
eukprot:COSAG04_NODE_5176_length_1713_cov_1.669145_2_plen_288_part_00